MNCNNNHAAPIFVRLLACLHACLFVCLLARLLGRLFVYRSFFFLLSDWPFRNWPIAKLNSCLCVILNMLNSMNKISHQCSCTDNDCCHRRISLLLLSFLFGGCTDLPYPEICSSFAERKNRLTGLPELWIEAWSSFVCRTTFCVEWVIRALSDLFSSIRYSKVTDILYNFNNSCFTSVEKKKEKKIDKTRITCFVLTRLDIFFSFSFSLGLSKRMYDVTRWQTEVTLTVSLTEWRRAFSCLTLWHEVIFYTTSRNKTLPSC